MIELLKQYGPALLTLILAYYRDQVMQAKNDVRIKALELKLKENHEKVDRDNANVSDADGVAKIAGPGSSSSQ